ncbi:MAG: glycoside hydrolase family 43 protein [bacterium]|nr:glycoside hydrolase family 43 protein [bacterium]
MKIGTFRRMFTLFLTGSLLVFAAACGSGEELSEERGQESRPDAFGGQNNAEAAADWTTEQLLEADFILYNVDCASEEPAVFAEGQICGLYQSVSDQPGGTDPGTGKNWGYRQADYMIGERDTLGEGITANKWNISEELYPGGEEGAFCYDFQLPKGDYRVTVGFYDPFGPRKIDVDCEGERMVEAEKILRFRLTEKQFDITVEDGELNLKVFNAEGKRAMDIPILSYIRIAAVPRYDRELLALALQKYAAEGGEDVYTADSYERYSRAVAEAEELLGEENPEKEDCERIFRQLKEGSEMLAEKYRYDSFRPGEQWRDTENNLIQAHGGQVQRLTYREEDTGEPVTKWVWVGEDKTAGNKGGIRAYSSEDLYNWQFEGIILRNVPSREALETEEYFKEVYGDYTAEQLDNVFRSLDANSAIIERPKLIYNEKTETYVLWFHADGPTETSDSSYAAACAGVAVSDSPFGPYRFIDRYRLNVCPEDQEDMYPSSKGMARDMNLFVDEDKTAYIIYSSEENLTLYISKLNEEYTYLAVPPEEAVYGKDFIRLYPGAQREAPAVFRRDGKYYLLSSGCTGWAPNQARYYVSDSILGEWENMGDPCIGDTERTTFQSQSTCVFEGPSGELIYMGDRWNSEKLSDSRYVWLPVEFSEDGSMELRWQDEWR